MQASSLESPGRVSTMLTHLFQGSDAATPAKPGPLTEPKVVGLQSHIFCITANAFFHTTPCMHHSFCTGAFTDSQAQSPRQGLQFRCWPRMLACGGAGDCPEGFVELAGLRHQRHGAQPPQQGVHLHPGQGGGRSASASQHPPKLQGILHPRVQLCLLLSCRPKCFR